MHGTPPRRLLVAASVSLALIAGGLTLRSAQAPTAEAATSSVTTSGTWTVPSPSSYTIEAIEVVASGGLGGGTGADGFFSACRVTASLAVTHGESLTIGIGGPGSKPGGTTGGSGGSGGNGRNGGAGADSSVSGQAAAGGGGATTASGGGGSFSGSGGFGSSFFTSTKSAFSSFGFSLMMPAFFVTTMRAATIAVWKITEVRDPPKRFCFWACDSRRLLNISLVRGAGDGSQRPDKRPGN